jgi:hypothetical protein
MEKRVKIFRSNNVLNLEVMINEYLKITQGKLHEIKMISHEFDQYTEGLVGLLIYTPEGEEYEKEICGAEKSKESHGGVQGKILAFRQQEGPYCKV